MAGARYFLEVEEWRSPEELGVIGRNLSLGAIVHELHLLADEPEENLQYMGLVQFSLMLACVGLPFSGT